MTLLSLDDIECYVHLRTGAPTIKKGLKEIVNSATHTRHAAIERLSEKIAPMRMEAAFAALFRIWSTADTYSTFPRNYESLDRFWTGSLITDLRNTKWCTKKWTVFLEKTADDLSLKGSKIRTLMTTTELRNRINDVTNQYMRGKRPADETPVQQHLTHADLRKMNNDWWNKQAGPRGQDDWNNQMNRGNGWNDSGISYLRGDISPR